MAKKITKEFYVLMDMNEEVSNSLGYVIRACGKHFFPQTISFKEWHKSKKYPKKDSEGKNMGSSKIWYKEYQEEIRKGLFKEVPYLDFWHWQIDNCFLENVYNDSYNSLYVGLEEDTVGKMTFWQKEIQEKYYELFYHLSKDGWIDVRISW